jgi:hypothetical protein
VATINNGLAIGERAYLGYVICEVVATSKRVGNSLDMLQLPVGEPDALEMVVGKFRQARLEQSFANGEIKLDDTLRLGNQYYDQLAAACELKDANEREAALADLETLLVDGDEAHDDAEDKAEEPAIVRVLAADPYNRSHAFAKAFLGQLIGPTESVVRGEYRRRASTHVIKVALAARLYQSQNGILPRALDDLKELIEGEASIEPQTGDPIGFCVLENEIVIYHWGHDRVDDGGAIDGERPKDWGIRIRE